MPKVSSSPIHRIRILVNEIINVNNQGNFTALSVVNRAKVDHFDLARLYFQMIEQILARDLENSDIFYKKLSPILNLLSHWDSLANMEGDQIIDEYFTDSFLDDLNILVMVFENENIELDIPNDSIPDFNLQIFELIKDCLDIDIDPDTKKFIIDHLKAIQNTLENLHIYGPEGLERTINENLGALFIKYYTTEKSEDSEKIFTRLFMLTVNLADVLNNSTDLIQKLSTAFPLLLGG